MTHERACQRQMLVGFVVFLVVVCFLHFNSIREGSARNLDEKNQWNQGIFGGEVVPNFYRLTVPKTLFKGIKIKGESEFYK